MSDSCLDVVGDPLHKVTALLVLHVKHLPVHLLHRYLPMESSSHSEEPAMAGVKGSHYVLEIKYLLDELWYSEDPISLTPIDD